LNFEQVKQITAGEVQGSVSFDNNRREKVRSKTIFVETREVENWGWRWQHTRERKMASKGGAKNPTGGLLRRRIKKDIEKQKGLERPEPRNK